MPQPLIECIPNFSEARRPEVVEAIIAAIQEVAGVSVLDRHSDLDHNRTVITMVGAPAAIEEAAFQSIKKAQELIDLDLHQGAHPRIGAADVVPFVPISEVSMTECVELARRLGKRVGEELSIPVYLYEEAASKPERQNLENIRKGQYEGLKTEIETVAERLPDFGPAKLGKAGATVIGARAPLIAFNIYLTTSDVEVAQKIARAVRNSSGGLRFVKGMGVLVEGMAQVSMNLTNFRKTPLFRVVELVRREAQRYGVGIHHSELVGLIPQEALIDSAVWYTQLDQFEPEQILENRLFVAQAQSTATTENPYFFIEQLASANPTPGGGSAAAFTAAEAAALVAMVGRVTVGKKSYAAVESRMWQMIEEADKLRLALTKAVEEDAEAFNGFMRALKLPRNNDEEIAARSAAMEEATLEAARVPHRVAGLAMQVLRLSLSAVEYGNLNAISDGASGFHLAAAAVRGATLNVKINCKSLQDPTRADAMLADVQGYEQKISALEQKVYELLRQRAQF
jgi:glutamate formiminotransferase/formiminotetrahydrofolate cyclodeaminase